MMCVNLEGLKWCRLIFTNLLDYFLNMPFQNEILHDHLPPWLFMACLSQGLGCNFSSAFHGMDPPFFLFWKKKWWVLYAWEALNKLLVAHLLLVSFHWYVKDINHLSSEAPHHWSQQPTLPLFHCDFIHPLSLALSRAETPISLRFHITKN